MIKTLFLSSIAFFFCGCATLDKYISPQQQCSLLRKGSYLSASFGIKEAKKKLDYEKYIKILKEKVIKKLTAKTPMSRKEWEGILSYLDKVLSNEVKQILLEQLHGLYAKVKLPETKDKSLSMGKRFVMYAKCIFYGLIDFFSQKLSVERGITKKSNDVKLFKDFDDICKLCEVECKTCPH